MSTNETPIVNIAYDADSVSWNIDSLRILIKELVTDETIVMYIISTTTDQGLVDRIVADTGIDEANVTIGLSSASVISELQSSKCNIFLSNDSVLGREVEDENNISLKPNNVTGSKFIEFNGILDHYKVQPKSLTSLTFWVDQIRKYMNGKEYKETS